LIRVVKRKRRAIHNTNNCTASAQHHSDYSALMRIGIVC